jgi:hypothetical protein
MYEVTGEKYMYLTYYVHLVGIKEVTDCKSAKLQNMQHSWALGPFPDWQALVICTSFLSPLPKNTHTHTLHSLFLCD